MSRLANAAHYVYRVYDIEGRLIYVGCTHEPEARLKRHNKSSWWAPQIAKVRIKVYPSRKAGLAAETEARNTEHPRWNIEARWIHRHDWTAQICADHITALENYAPDVRTPRYQGRIDKARAFQKKKFATHALAA